MDHESGAPSEWAGSGHEVSQDLSERIREVISAAEAAASAIRYEAEQYAQGRRREAEADAEERRREAEVEAQRHIADARRDAEAVLAERIRRVSELSDTIIERSESVLARIDRAAEVKRELDSLAAALGETAARLAREARIEPAEGASRPPAPPRAEVPPDVETVEATSVEEPDLGADAREESEPVDAEEVHPEPEPASVEAAAAEPAPAAEPAEPAEASGEKPKQRSTFLRRVIMRDAPPDEHASGAPAASHEDDKAAATDGSEDQLLGARLIALQMAVAGANRGEVEQHLRRTVDLQAAEAVLILDDVFGVGTDTSKRVAWPSATADR